MKNVFCRDVLGHSCAIPLSHAIRPLPARFARLQVSCGLDQPRHDANDVLGDQNHLQRGHEEHHPRLQGGPGGAQGGRQVRWGFSLI
jgi:hypothetical protein